MSSIEPITGQPTKPKHAGGRPQKYTADEIAEIYTDFEDYIDRTADPIIVGFTSSYKKYHVNKWYMSERPEFSDLIKSAIEKQEYYIQYGAISNSLNATFAIFRLKQPQHGWSDRTQTDITTGGDKLGLGLSAEQAEQLIKARTTRSDI
jgi:hypothetical protein